MNKLIDPNSDVSLNDINETNIDTYEAVAWSIDVHGRDRTKYLDIIDDVNTFNQTADGDDCFYHG